MNRLLTIKTRLTNLEKTFSLDINLFISALQIQAEIRCLDADRKRLERDKVDCEKSIEERKRA